MIDSGNLVGDVVSEEFAWQANLASEACQKEIETATASGKMQIIGRATRQVRIAGIGTPFDIQPWIVQGMKNAVNLGQLFLSRNNAQLTFMEVKYTWRRKGTAGSTDELTMLRLPPDPGTGLHQKRGRVPGRLCFPLGSGRGCWAGNLGSAAGGAPATSGDLSANRTP